jgi:pyruvate,water dikinase
MQPRPLVEIEDDHAHGGKAAQLGGALRAGLPVPPGFALADDQVEAIVRAGTVSREVGDTLATLGGIVAVRSSAIGEDGATASFAGQHATVLGVTSVDALVAAIRTVRDSAHAASALAYRKRLGLDAAPRMAVVIQRIIDADTAGVLFTRNPMTGADERVIEGAWGLGEIVVAGLVTPDRFRIARDGRVLERTPGEKDLAIRLRRDGGTEETPVDADRAAALCLTDAQLAALHALASRCEAHATAPQDLEWAFERDALFLLQRRAITRLGTSAT